LILSNGVSDDVKAAVAEATSEVGSGAVVEDSKPAAAVEAKTEDAKVDNSVEDDDDAVDAKAEDSDSDPARELFENLTADDLAAIEKDPVLRKAYKSMLRGFRDKTTTLANERKTLGERAKLAESIIADPDTSLRALAAIRGIKLVDEPKAPEVKSEMDVAYAKLEETLGPEGANILRPVFEAVVNTAVETRVGPIERRAAELEKKHLADSITSGLRSFKAEVKSRGDEWSDDIEADMAKLVGKVTPAEGVELNEYLDLLHSKAVLDRQRKGAVKAKIARLRTASEPKEPTVGVRPTTDAPARITSDMSDSDAIALAVQMARNEVAGR
jgi:hypothetical protein